MRRVSYLESIHLGSLNFKEIPICLCVVPFVTQWSGIQKDQKGSSLFITLTSFIWISVPHEPQHRAWAMSQSFDQIYFEARSEIWRFCSLIIPSNGAIRRCWCFWVLSSDESKKCDPCSIALSCQCSLHVHHFSYCIPGCTCWTLPKRTIYLFQYCTCHEVVFGFGPTILISKPPGFFSSFKSRPTFRKILKDILILCE